MTAEVFVMVLGAAFLHAAWNAMVKDNSDRLSMVAIMMAGQAVLAVLVVPFVAFPPTESWVFIWASTGLHTAYFLFLTVAYRFGDLSQVYPIARGASPLIIAAASVYFVGEVLSRNVALAITLIAVGVMSLTLTRGQDGLRQPKAILFALATSVFIAGYTLVDGLGARLADSAHSYIFWLNVFNGLPIIIIALYLRWGRVLVHVKTCWKPGLLSGFISLGAYWIVLWAITLAPMALVSAVRETSMIFAVIFGVFVLKEPLNLVRLASTSITLAGVVLLKMSK